MPWATDDAEELAAGLGFAEEIGPCPACGAHATVDVIWVGLFNGDNMYLPGESHCSADCWQEDPVRYLDAVREVKSVEHDQSK